MNKKALTLLVLFAVLACGFLWASEGTFAEVIPLSSSVYQEMDDLYALADMGTPSNSRPWTKGEALMILHRIDAERLSKIANALYSHLEAAVEPGLRWQFDDGFGLGVNIDLNGEMYAHTNTDDYVMDTDWAYDYERRAPLANGRFAFGVGKYFYNFFDFSFGTARESYNDDIVELKDAAAWTTDVGIGALIPGDYYDGDGSTIHNIYYDQKYELFARQFGTNFPAFTDITQEFPNRAVLAFGGTNWVASFSRDRINWGNSHIGNLVIDDHVKNHTYARVAAFSNRFKFEATYLFFDTNPYSEDDLDAADWAPAKYTRIFMTHRLEFRIGKWVNLALSEDIMYQSPNGLNLYYMNPSYIFHNLDDKRLFNSLASLEVDVMPIKGLNLYGQFVMDQAQSLNEGDEQADANGYLAGVEYTLALGPGVLSTAVEYAKTTPELYRRNGVDFIMMTKHGVVSSSGYHHVTRFDYIGFPYGGDAQVIKWDVDYRIPDTMEAKFSITHMIHGQMSFFTSHNSTGNNSENPDITDDTPYGTVTRSTTFSLYGKYIVPNFVSWMEASVYGEVDYLTRTVGTEAASNDFQFVLGIGLTF
ncbi:MAG: hypothetical protein ACOX6K_05490 [Sphaerochaetaceae bacterium]